MDWPWNFTSADWAGLQFLVLAAAACVAFWQAMEARRLRRAQAEPFVVVDFEVQASQQQIYLVISNIGKTTARDVRVTFDPELSSASFDAKPGIVPPRDLKPFREGVSSLPPGKRVPVLIDIFHQRNAELFPDVYSVHIEFYAPALKRKITDDSIIDLGIYRNILHTDRADLHDIHARLKELVTETKKWTAGDSGVLALRPRDRRIRDADSLDYVRSTRSMAHRLFYEGRIRLRRMLFS